MYFLLYQLFLRLIAPENLAQLLILHAHIRGKNLGISSSIYLRSRENDFVRLMLVGIFVDYGYFCEVHSIPQEPFCTLVYLLMPWRTYELLSLHQLASRQHQYVEGGPEEDGCGGQVVQGVVEQHPFSGSALFGRQ